MHQSSPRSIGREVHTEATAITSVAEAHHAEVVSLGNLG
jgi:hypothetical protein